MNEDQIKKFKEDLQKFNCEELVNKYSENFLHSYLEHMLENHSNELQFIFDDYLENGYNLDELKLLDVISIIREFKNYY